MIAQLEARTYANSQHERSDVLYFWQGNILYLVSIACCFLPTCIFLHWHNSKGNYKTTKNRVIKASLGRQRRSDVCLRFLAKKHPLIILTNVLFPSNISQFNGDNLVGKYKTSTDLRIRGTHTSTEEIKCVSDFGQSYEQRKICYSVSTAFFFFLACLRSMGITARAITRQPRIAQANTIKIPFIRWMSNA